MGIHFVQTNNGDLISCLLCGKNYCLIAITKHYDLCIMEKQILANFLFVPFNEENPILSWQILLELNHIAIETIHNYP